MIDPKVFENAGMTPEKYKAKFTAEKKSEKIEALLNRLSSNTQDGVQFTWDNARVYWAVDRAYDVPFYQTSATMMRGLVDKKFSTEKVLSMVNNLGLTHMLTDIPCTCGDSDCKHPKKQKLLDVPVFTQIFYPLVMSYVKIRWAKIFDDRDLYPVFKFEPLKLTTKERLRCEILTDRGQKVSAQMGYREIKRKVIFDNLLYGICLQFPMEDWYTEKQKDVGGKTVITKEGIRYFIPHPSKTFYDMAHRPDTINSDTGCNYYGYWNIVRARELRANKDFWNLDEITFGSDWLGTAATGSAYDAYRQLFPCTANFPTVETVGTGSGDLDREKSIYRYNTKEADQQAVMVTNQFARLIPKDYDLGDYEYPVWFHFVMGNERTVLYCKPYAYTPGIYYGYDADGNRSLNAGMGMEILPTQDMLWNYLTQYLYTVKKNLRSAVFWNSDGPLTQTEIDKIQNLGDKMITDTAFIPFSMKERGWAQQPDAQKQAFWPVNFPEQDTSQMANAIKMLIDIMERTLGVSPQEVGQAASHEQSATETQVVAQNVSTRLALTAGFIDDGLYAWKRQLYDGIMAYSDDEMFAQVANLNDVSKKALEELGFKIEEEPVAGESHAGVRGKKASLTVEGIASTRDNKDRINNPQIAAAMAQITQSMLALPEVRSAIGVKQIVDWWNTIAEFAGVPRDQKVTVVNNATPDEQAQESAKQIAQISQQIVDKNLTAMATTLKEQVFGPMQQAIQQLGQGQQQLAEGQAQVGPVIDNIVTSQTQIAEGQQALAQKGQQTEAAVLAIREILAGMIAPQPQIPNIVGMQGAIAPTELAAAQPIA